MTSVDSNFNFLCGRPNGAGPPSPIHMRPPELDPPCGHHKWIAPYHEVVNRAVKSCQKTHPGNRSRQDRLTVYTLAYSHVDQGRFCHLCQTQFKGPGHYLCE